MKHITKNFLTSACAVALLGSFGSAFADIVSDTESLLNWAELTYPEIFTTHKTTLSDGPWLYRNYSEVGILAGVNKDDNNVYVMGGPWGNAAPTIVGPLSALMATVNGNPSSNQLCDASALPAGMSMTQNGNVYNITTNGCIVPPTDQNYCEFALPATPVVTGISVLTTGVVKKMEMKGLLVTVPGTFDQLLQSGLDYKTCVINAPTEAMADLTVNMNVCYDLTALFSGIQSVPGFITVTPPIQQTLEATSTTTRVSDCFATDATSVSDLVTNQVWVKTNGTWNEISTTP